jgi:hypothetical protein
MLLQDQRPLQGDSTHGCLLPPPPTPLLASTPAVTPAPALQRARVSAAAASSIHPSVCLHTHATQALPALAHIINFPHLSPLPADFLTAMEEYVREAPREVSAACVPGGKQVWSVHQQHCAQRRWQPRQRRCPACWLSHTRDHHPPSPSYYCQVDGSSGLGGGGRHGSGPLASIRCGVRVCVFHRMNPRHHGAPPLISVPNVCVMPASG